MVRTPKRSEIPWQSTPCISTLYLCCWLQITFTIDSSVVKCQSELYFLCYKIHKLFFKYAMIFLVYSQSQLSYEHSQTWLWQVLTISLIFSYLCCLSSRQLLMNNPRQIRLQRVTQYFPYFVACFENYFQKVLNWLLPQKYITNCLINRQILMVSEALGLAGENEVGAGFAIFRKGMAKTNWNKRNMIARQSPFLFAIINNKVD